MVDSVTQGVEAWPVELESGGRAGYRPVEFWPLVPHPMTFGSNAASVAAGSDGLVYVLSRSAWPLMVFDAGGNLRFSWSSEVLAAAKPHGIDVDPDGGIYLVDADVHTVEKRTPDGDLVFRVGEHGVASSRDVGDPFNRPTDVAVDPVSREFFVSDGYGNSRVHHFDPAGRLIASWGSSGSDPGEFGLPHGIALFGDEVVVCDRENYRLQFFSRDGTFTRQWHVHHPLSVSSGGPDGYLYVGEMGPPPIQRGVPGLGHRVSIWNDAGERVGRLGDGTAGAGPAQFYAPHGITADGAGNVYVAEVPAQWIGKFWGDEVPLGELRSIRKWARDA